MFSVTLSTTQKQKVDLQYVRCNVRTLQQIPLENQSHSPPPPLKCTRGEGWGMGVVFEGPKLRHPRVPEKVGETNF